MLRTLGSDVFELSEPGPAGLGLATRRGMVEPLRPSEFRRDYAPIQTADLDRQLHAQNIDLTPDQITALQSVDTDRDGVIGNTPDEVNRLYQQIYNLGLPSDRAAATARALCHLDPNGGVQIGARGMNDRVLYVGLNPGAGSEARALRNAGANVSSVQSSAAGQGMIAVGDGRGGTRTLDLGTDAGVHDFVSRLDLAPDQSARVEDAIKSVRPSARDEMAQIAQVWARAERGGSIPSRLVLSGHSIGYGVWGDGNGSITFDNIGRLAQAMPRAAAQVEDVAIAACYAGTEDNATKFQAMFPNMKTFSGYFDQSPASGSGAEGQLQRWESATRGRTDRVSRGIFGQSGAVWSARTGYVDGRPAAPLADVRSEWASGDATYQRYLSGDRPLGSPNERGPGSLRGYYNDTQRLAQRTDLPQAERPAVEARRDQAIRLLFFQEKIAPRFATEHRQQLEAGYRAVGLGAVPSIATMTRQDAVTEVARFNAAFDAKVRQGWTPSAEATEARRLLNSGLRDLDRSVIPENWI